MLSKEQFYKLSPMMQYEIKRIVKEGYQSMNWESKKNLGGGETWLNKQSEVAQEWRGWFFALEQFHVNLQD